MRKARIEAPEKVSFHSVRLQPSWFVDTDSHKFVFTNILWTGGSGRSLTVKGELSALEHDFPAGSEDIARLLSIACRQLADNWETNSRFEDASMFRRMAMETEWIKKKARLRRWIRESNDRVGFVRSHQTAEPKTPDASKNTHLFRNGSDYFIHGIYRWTSYYGESWGWASLVLAFLILVIFPAAFLITDFQVCPRDKPVSMSIATCVSAEPQVKNRCECARGTLGVGEALVHSLTTATLQNVDYRKPTTKKGEATVILEKIFAPLQAALLALALRRKFMR